MISLERQEYLHAVQDVFQRRSVLAAAARLLPAGSLALLC